MQPICLNDSSADESIPPSIVGKLVSLAAAIPGHDGTYNGSARAIVLISSHMQLRRKEISCETPRLHAVSILVSFFGYRLGSFP